MTSTAPRESLRSLSPGLCVAVGILARNEAQSIGAVLKQVCEQSLLKNAVVDVHVVANGCTDQTGEVARQALSAFPAGLTRKRQVFETEVAGKSRAWNSLVHKLTASDCDFILLLDADVTLAHSEILSDMCATLLANAKATACAGRPAKSIARKARKSALERFSLAVSAQQGAAACISGGLYVAKARELRKIWLPEPTPAEDGFINACIHTDGFTIDPDPERICQPDQITHFFEAVGVGGYLKHEKRIILGTVINNWLFEHFMAHPEQRPLGQIIRTQNEQDPGWVGRIVRSKAQGRRWAIPPKMLTWRFAGLRGTSGRSSAKGVLVAAAATGLNLLPCLLANRSLHAERAEAFW